MSARLYLCLSLLAMKATLAAASIAAARQPRTRPGEPLRLTAWENRRSLNAAFGCERL